MDRYAVVRDEHGNISQILAPGEGDYNGEGELVGWVRTENLECPVEDTEAMQSETG